MTIRNKVLVTIVCNTKEDMYTEWCPINFGIYSELFPDVIDEAITEWLSEADLRDDMIYEVIFAHYREIDGAGAVLDECFKPIYHEYRRND